MAMQYGLPTLTASVTKMARVNSAAGRTKKGRKRVLKTTGLTAIIAVALAVLLIWKSPLITRGVFRAGFLLGLATLGAIVLLSRTGPREWAIHLHPGPLTSLAVAPLVFAASLPFILLVETGVVGYRGFTSWMRYLSLCLTVLGVVGLAASLLLPWFLRR